MKRRTFLGVAGTALTGTAAVTLLPDNTARAGTVVPLTAVETTVLALEQQWLNAMVERDEVSLGSLMADDFKRIEKPWPNISMFKPQWISNAVRGYRIESFKYLTSSIRVSGDNAFVTSCYRWRGALGEVPLNEIVTAEDTWELRDGRWQIVQQFVSNTEKLGPKDKPVGGRNAISVDPAVYLAYAGRYQFGPSRILTISHEDGRLMHQGSGGQRAELFPETKTRFFRKDVGVLSTFVVKNGRATHLVHRHSNGRESIGTRIA